jgi:hypothetical protein
VHVPVTDLARAWREALPALMDQEPHA